jgi:hypothetical protein
MEEYFKNTNFIDIIKCPYHTTILNRHNINSYKIPKYKMSLNSMISEHDANRNELNYVPAHNNVEREKFYPRLIYRTLFWHGNVINVSYLYQFYLTLYNLHNGTNLNLGATYDLEVPSIFEFNKINNINLIHPENLINYDPTYNVKVFLKIDGSIIYNFPIKLYSTQNSHYNNDITHSLHISLHPESPVTSSAHIKIGRRVFDNNGNTIFNNESKVSIIIYRKNGVIICQSSELIGIFKQVVTEDLLFNLLTFLSKEINYCDKLFDFLINKIHFPEDNPVLDINIIQAIIYQINNYELSISNDPNPPDDVFEPADIPIRYHKLYKKCFPKKIGYINGKNLANNINNISEYDSYRIIKNYLITNGNDEHIVNIPKKILNDITYLQDCFNEHISNYKKFSDLINKIKFINSTNADDNNYSKFCDYVKDINTDIDKINSSYKTICNIYESNYDKLTNLNEYLNICGTEDIKYIKRNHQIDMKDLKTFFTCLKEVDDQYNNFLTIISGDFERNMIVKVRTYEKDLLSNIIKDCEIQKNKELKTKNDIILRIRIENNTLQQSINLDDFQIQTGVTKKGKPIYDTLKGKQLKDAKTNAVAKIQTNLTEITRLEQEILRIKTDYDVQINPLKGSHTNFILGGSYHKKYLKYKTKYLQLKKQLENN